MSDLRVKRLWCLNDQAVPLVEAAVDIQDLENLLPEGDKENMSVFAAEPQGRHRPLD